ncbi:MAG: LysR family transcriptional regulator [Pseudomonadota bacterium]
MVRSVTHQTLRRLAYFEAIAQAGSIRGAAQRMGLSVPVLSSALSELEAELNVTLATRSTRRMELTSAGQQVHREASYMLEAAQNALAHSGKDQKLSGTVGITLPAELALHWLPSRLSAFDTLCPEVTLSIDANDRVVDLAGSAYDIAIRTEYRPVRPETDHEDSMVFGWLDLVMVAREPLIVRPKESEFVFVVEGTFMVGPGGSDWIAGYLPRSTSPIILHPSKLMMVANRETAIAFAKQGLGYALVTELSVRGDLEAGRLVRIRPDMTFGGITLQTVMRDNLPSPAAKLFQSILAGVNSKATDPN